MEVVLAFQRTLKKKSSLRDKVETKLISWWTGCKYFHVEIIIQDKWVSSGPTHGGAFIRKLKPLDVEHYDYFSVVVDEDKVHNVWRFIEGEVGTGYDWKGVWLSQFLRLDRHTVDKWFCSEIVAEILTRFGVELEYPSNKYAPKDLYNEVVKWNQ